MKEKAASYLRKDRLLNFDMLRQLDTNAECEIIYAESDGVMLIPNERIIMISVDSPEKCRELLSSVQKKVFCAHNDYCESIIRQMYPEIRAPQVCYNAVYDSHMRFDTDTFPFFFDNLHEEHIQKVESIYSTVEKPGYISERIESGCLFGCFCDEGTLMGIGGIHDDGSIGMIYTFTEFRGKGVGKFLSGSLVNYELDHERIPYVQINRENMISVNMYKKLGFKFSDKFMYWI